MKYLETIRKIEKQHEFKFSKVEDFKIDEFSTKDKIVYSIDNEENITSLSISMHDFHDVFFLKNIRTLKKLRISYSQIVDISALKELPLLEELDLKRNQIQDVSPLKELINLRTLDLFKNSISDISALKELTNLEKLDIANNKVTDVSSLKELVNIEDLNLNNNNIEDISYLKKLTKLKFLSLNDNKIIDLSALKELKRLNVLNLQNNPIIKLPEWMVDFEMEIRWDETGNVLDYISLFNNPLQNIPIEIIQQGKKAIKRFFHEFERRGVDYLYEAKLIIVGEERSGKSTIARLLGNLNYIFNSSEKSTEGIDISYWTIPKEKTNTPKDFQFSVWDFGGQEIYHATHQLFLSKRAVYLFVTEARKDFRYDDFYYWLNLINLYAHQSPIIIVQNKSDLPHVEKNIAEYKKLFPQVEGYYKVSCLQNLSLDLLKEAIYEIIKKNKLVGVGATLPKVWIDIRKELNQLQNIRKYISLNQYLDLCNSYSLNRKEALLLSDYFHDLGIFLHFKNDIQLRNVIFLNFNWITNGIYKILDNRTLVENYGKISEEKLINILTEPEYTEMQAELISLIKAFDICYESSGGFYLFPQLFNSQKINYTWKDNKNNLRYRYSYKFMPKDILSKLIIKLNKYVKGNNFWRYGVLISYNDNRAKVEEVIADKCINIEIEGEAKKELLTIIRHNFNEIHRSYGNLELSEKIPCNCVECINSNTPLYYDLLRINRATHRGKRTIECQISFLEVNIASLLGEVEISNKINLSGDGNIILQDTKGTDITINLDEYQNYKNQKSDFYKKLKDIKIQIAKNETEKSIRELLKLSNKKSDLYNQIILLSSRSNQIKLEKEVHAITLSDANIEINKIQKSLLEIVDELQRNELISQVSDNVFIDLNNKKELPFAIKQVCISNFKGIKEIKLEKLPVDAQWIFLTGENGYGKTSLLQAIVAGFIGKKDKKEIIVEDNNSSIGLEFLENEKSVINNIGSPSFSEFYNFSAYGSARLLTQGQVQSTDDRRTQRTYNIFNDDGILLDIEDKLKVWERSTNHNEKEYFNLVRASLIKILPNINEIIVDKNRVKYIETERNENQANYQPLLFKELAAGYKSIIAMVGDMVIRLIENQPSIKDISELGGIVIIDEFDLHLHPKWQKKFVEILTDTFPNIQFITSTHSAIPLLGAPKNSIFLNVNRTVSKGIIAKRIEIDIKTLLPNSLLTSPLFDFFDITQKEYDNETDKLRTENYFDEIIINNEIKSRVEQFAKINSIDLEGKK